MKKLKPLALSLAALVVVAFVLLYFEADLLWKVQQHNVFLHSSLFFRQQMVVPGGMLSWLGGFLTQHFYYPWLGVVVLCAVWLLLTWLTRRAFRIPDQWWALPLVPVAILLLANMQLGYWVYVIKLRGFFYVATLGAVAGTALLWAFRSLPDKWWLRALFVVLVALVGYPLMGVYALATIILMGLINFKPHTSNFKSQTSNVLLALLCVVAVPLLYYRFVYYETNLSDIYTAALPVFAIVDDYPQYYYPYIALAGCYLLLAVVPLKTSTSNPKLQTSNIRLQIISNILLLAAVAGCVWHFWYKDANFHHELRMQRCIEQADWEGVVAEGTKQDGQPTRSIVMMHNLALSRLGRQCDEMYRFPKGSAKPNTPLPIYMYHVAGRMMLYQYGMMNECHRICMEDGVEYGWSVELLKYMARCAIFSGEQQAARKFLDLLRQTCYHASWADHMQQLMADRQQLTDDPETGPITHMQHYTDRLDAVEGWVEKHIMTTLAAHDADDLYFQQQAVLGALWTRDPAYFWPRFEHYVQLVGDGPVPRIFQEAAWLFANLEGQEGLDEWELARGVQSDFAEFMKLFSQFRQQPSASARQYLLDRFGTTYYFEFFFLRDITYY